MSLSAQIYKIRNKTDKVIWLGQKYLLQHLRCRSNLEPAPLFIVGCQRSGTNMLIQVLGESLETWIYSASNRRAFDNRRIKPAAEIRQLLEDSRCRWLVFKPLSDTQNTDRLLADHPHGKAIWIYRQYQDVANSAVRSWGEWQRVHIHRVATKPDWQHWMVERMSEEHRQLVRQLYRGDMSLHTAAALKWYLRNAIYFEYHLDRKPERVRLVKYEELVLEPANYFRLLFNFLEIEFKPSFVSNVHPASVGKEGFPRIDKEVERLCEQLLDRLNRTLVSKVHHCCRRLPDAAAEI